MLEGKINEGGGDRAPSEFHVRAPGITEITIRYTRENSPHPPTNRDLVKVFETVWYITANKNYPKPNPPFSRELKFGLAFENEPNQDWAAKVVAQLLETDSELFASS